MSKKLAFSKEEIAELASRYKKLYSGVVYDALFEVIRPEFPFVLSREIGPLWDDGVLCGPAFTVRGSRLFNPEKKKSITARMVEEMYDGCIEVISSASCDKISVFGEITASICRRHGAIGTITDGCSRDAAALKAMGYKVYSRGVAMVDSQGRWTAVEYQVPTLLDGAEGDVMIYPSDYIFADGDGVLVIPQKNVWETLEEAERKAEKEKRIRELVKQGIKVEEIKKKEGRW